MEKVLDFLDRPLVGVILASLAVLAFLVVILGLGQVSALSVFFLVASSAELGWFGHRLAQDKNVVY